MGRLLVVCTGLALAIWSCSGSDAPETRFVTGGTGNGEGGGLGGQAEDPAGGASRGGTTPAGSDAGATGNEEAGAGGATSAASGAANGGMTDSGGTPNMGGAANGGATDKGGAANGGSTDNGGAANGGSTDNGGVQDGGAGGGAPETPTTGTCQDGNVVRVIVKPSAGQLVISEVLANPAGNDALREWFEIANVGGTPFDLNELTFKTPVSTDLPIVSSTCISIVPGAFGLIASSLDGDQNGGLPSVDATFSFALVNSGAAGVSVLDGATLLDAVTWTASSSGQSMSLAPSHLSATDNDDPTSWCKGTSPYGDATNEGTPRALNLACP